MVVLYCFSIYHFTFSSFEANAEIYNEAYYDAAQQIRHSHLKVTPDEDSSHRHYLDRRSLSRAMRLFLLG